ncbi:MAG: sugar phosphate isomerase/epimerase [Clostridia bacterium]|nr:sugar phosphate isomerase/epimerase [Clostridia bacterium]
MLKGFGLYANFGYPLKMDERAKIIKAAGFQAASLWWEEYDPVNEIPLLKQPEVLQRAGLAIDYVHAPFININDIWTNSRFAQDCVQAHCRWLEECACFAIPILVMHVTLFDLAYYPNEFGLDNLRRIVAKAEEQEVTLALENVGNTDHLEYLLDRIASPYLKLCYDSSHNWVFTPHKAPQLLEKYIDRLACTHLSDNDQKEDRHWLPGRGKVDWPGLKQIWQKHNYSSYLSLEVFPQDYQQKPEDFVQEAWDSVQSLNY